MVVVAEVEVDIDDVGVEELEIGFPVAAEVNYCKHIVPCR